MSHNGSTNGHTPLGGSRADGPIAETIAERAFVEARRLTNAVERFLVPLEADVAHDERARNAVADLAQLRCNSDEALYDAERAFGLADPDGDLAAAGFASWPPEGWDIDRARDLLKVSRNMRALEEAAIVMQYWAKKLGDRHDKRSAAFGIHDDTIPETLAILEQERIRILADERIAGLKVLRS